MRYVFEITVTSQNESYSAAALGVQGEWSRNLSTALEALLNKLLAQQIEERMFRDHEQNQKNEAQIARPNPVGVAPVGDVAPPPSKKTAKDKS